MHLSNENGSLNLKTETYQIAIPQDRPYLYLSDFEGRRLLELFVLSGVQPVQGRDDTLSVDPWQVEEGPEEVTFSLHCVSTAWEGKTYRFHCHPHRLTYEIEVEGDGPVWEVDYFGGYYSGQIRWGSGFLWSGQKFSRAFTPEPSTDQGHYFNPAQGSAIDLMGVPLPGKGNWFFTPPPFLYAFEGEHGWVGMGVEARPAENHYTEYIYHTRSSAFFLSLSYEGHFKVSGKSQLPAIGFDFGIDEFEVLATHASHIRLRNWEIAGLTNKPDWWYEPIFCGWGAQCAVAAVEKSPAQRYSQQSLYEAFLERLSRNGVCPGTVVIDDKWQQTYGDNLVDPAKWPDLPGFIRGQHAQGRKVLLWFKAWDPEGIPAEECITNGAGIPAAVDPTHPAFERRLRECVRRMLSPSGYDADGLKIDFTARIPSGPNLHIHGDLWGLELMKRYLWIIYDEAKQVKADALVMTHTPHPYLEDVLDMVRLNDIVMEREVNPAMALRAHIASTACPEAIIDTDNWPLPDKETWRNYLTIQSDLGVPSLYYASAIDATCDPLEEQDYRLIRESWEQYRLISRHINRMIYNISTGEEG